MRLLVTGVLSGPQRWQSLTKMALPRLHAIAPRRLSLLCVLSRGNHLSSHPLLHSSYISKVKVNGVRFGSNIPLKKIETPVQPDTNVSVKLLMYDMPLRKQITKLRAVFLFSVLIAAGAALFINTDDIFIVFVAGAMAVVGFIPLALVNVMYGSHIRCIRILGGINRRLLKKARKEEKSGKSQIEFPVENNTPLLIQKFSVFPLDPTIPLYVRDLEPGPSRKYSVQWMYKGRTKTEVFRISKKVIQFHPDVRALDMLIRKNAAMKSGASNKSNTENETKML